jgi:hypothetical protein
MARHFRSVTVGLCIALMLPLGAAASTIFTNFGASQGYNISSGNPIGNAALDGNDYAEGDTFTPSASATFGSLDIALSCSISCPVSFVVKLTADGGDQPGTVLESFSSAGSSLGTLGTHNTPLTFTAVGAPITLTAGTQYWITVASGLNDSIVWNWNSTSDTSDEAISTDTGATWFSPSGLTPGAYDVISASSTTTPTPAPEPGSIWLMAGGLSLFLIHKSKLRQA